MSGQERSREEALLLVDPGREKGRDVNADLAAASVGGKTCVYIYIYIYTEYAYSIDTVYIYI